MSGPRSHIAPCWWPCPRAAVPWPDEVPPSWPGDPRWLRPGGRSWTGAAPEPPWSCWVSGTWSPSKGHRSWSAQAALSQEETSLPHSSVLLASMVVLASPSPSLFNPPVISAREALTPSSSFPVFSISSLPVTSLGQGNIFFYPLVQYLGNDLHAFMGRACPCLEMQEKRIAWAWRALALQNIPRGGCLVSLAMLLERLACTLWG